MCHHLVDTDERYRVDEPAEQPTDEPADGGFETVEDPAVDVELDREYDQGDAKTPGDD